MQKVILVSPRLHSLSIVHPKFVETKVVPDIPGTPAALVGKTLKELGNVPGGLHLQTYGGFEDNSAVGTFQIGIDLSYFGSSVDDTVGSIVQGAEIISLAKSGKGISTTHSTLFTLEEVTIEGEFPDNDLTGIWCNNCNGCTLSTPNVTLSILNVETVRGGNC
mmetsp:Transcript_25205/g.44169  ORF Transcript_25205/g.44169 Transcript_25205/m.44169 type:complete len:163 (-) Transcript_25205:448-936(-)